MRSMGYLKYFDLMSDLETYVDKIKKIYGELRVSVENTHVYVANSPKGFYAVEVEIKNIL